MTRRHRLSDESVAKLKANSQRYNFADPELPGQLRAGAAERRKDVLRRTA